MIPGRTPVRLPTWDYLTLDTPWIRKNKWMTIPLTCGIPCVISYQEIKFPFPSPYSRITPRQKHPLSMLFEPFRALLNRSEVPHLKIEAELCWTALDSTFSLAQCTHALFSETPNHTTEHILRNMRLHLLDILPSSLHHRCPIHVSCSTPIEDRAKGLWWLLFGKKRFENIYCAQYTSTILNEEVASLFHRNTRGIPGPHGSTGVVFNAARFVAARSTFTSDRPVFQFSPRLVQESVQVTKNDTPYLVKCQTQHGTHFDLLRVHNHEGNLVSGVSVPVLHFGYCGFDGRPHQAISNYELHG